MAEAALAAVEQTGDRLGGAGDAALAIQLAPWLAPAAPHGGVAAGLRLSQALQRCVRLRGGATAVVDGEVSLTWLQFAERATRLAGALQGLGMKDGDRICMLSNNSHRYLEFYFGVPWGGGVFTPLNFRLALPELVAIVSHAGASVLIVDDAWAELGAQVAAAAGVACLIHAGDGPTPAGMLAYEELLAAASPAPDRGRGGDDVAALFYTSGSTGAPKGVMHSHANILYSAVSYAAAIKLDEESVALISGPLFHVGAAGICIPAMVAGGRIVLLPKFEPAPVARAIGAYGVTVTSLVPTMLRMVLDDPASRDNDLSSLRTLLYGAAPMPERLLNEALALMPQAQFIHCYGMTEATASCTALPSRYVSTHRHEGRVKSCGRALTGLDVAVFDPDGAPLPPGEMGEIVVRGPTVMLGYWREPELTARTIRDGWLHTGDLGYQDAEGFVYLVDRLKDMIITGGENVYSSEVEDVICSLPGVSQCAVIGMPHPRWGEQVHAIIAMAPGADLTEEAVIAHCRSRIAGYKCPRSVDLRTEPLPLSGANKINKPLLRKSVQAPG